MTPLMDEVYYNIQHFKDTTSQSRGTKVVVYMRTDFLNKLLEDLHNDGADCLYHDDNKLFGHAVYEVIGENHPPFTVALIKEEQ